MLHNYFPQLVNNLMYYYWYTNTLFHINNKSKVNYLNLCYKNNAASG